MDKTRKKYIVLVIVTIVISIVALIGASYALLTMTIEGDKKDYFNSRNIKSRL